MSSMTMMTRVSRMTTMTGKTQLYESLNSPSERQISRVVSRDF